MTFERKSGYVWRTASQQKYGGWFLKFCYGIFLGNKIKIFPLFSIYRVCIVERFIVHRRDSRINDYYPHEPWLG